MLEKPKLIGGVFPFKGEGLDKPFPLAPELTYTVRSDRRSQLTYFRAGNAAAELVYVLIQRNGLPMRYFPIGGNSALHVPLAVVEDLHAGTRIDIFAAAPGGSEGQLVLDMGFVEF